MEDWMNRQQALTEEAQRGPRTGFTEPAEERGRRTRVFHETYSVFRPWSSCNRCRDVLKEQPELLPENGDYICPHTRHDEYIVLINRLRNAGPSGPVSLQSREFSNERGEIYVTIAWEEPETTAVETKVRPRGVPRL